MNPTLGFLDILHMGTYEVQQLSFFVGFGRVFAERDATQKRLSSCSLSKMESNCYKFPRGGLRSGCLSQVGVWH